MYLSFRISQVVSGQEQCKGEEGRVVDNISYKEVVRVEVGAHGCEDDVFPEAEVVQAKHAGAAKEDGKQSVLHDVQSSLGVSRSQNNHNSDSSRISESIPLHKTPFFRGIASPLVLSDCLND